MKKTTVYLDTSVINFLYADDAPEKMAITIDFFRNYVKKGIYETYISPVVIDEINKTTDTKKRLKLLKVINDYKLKVIDISPFAKEIESLTNLYIIHKIIPEKKLEDALHLAISTIFDIDVFLSWNYKHLANVNKERKIMSVNMLEGYTKSFKMVTPMEVVYEED
jgi:hypothetical protein